MAGTGGASSALYQYIKRKEAALKTPVADQIRQSILERRPDLDEHEVDMFMDVIAMDRQRFTDYAEKVGYSPDLADDFFKEVRGAEAQMERLKMAVQDRATYKDVGADGKEYVRLGQLTPDRLYDKINVPVGADSDETIQVLQDKHGIQVDIHTDIPEQRLHKELSQLSNWLDESPVLGKIFREQGGRVEYVDRPSHKPTAAASWDYGTIRVYYKPGDSFMFAATWPHEIGHAAEAYSTVKDVAEVFHRGKMVSSYAWTNWSEDFAETFTSIIMGDKGAMQWAGPEKIGFIMENVPGL